MEISSEPGGHQAKKTEIFRLSGTTLVRRGFHDSYCVINFELGIRPVGSGGANGGTTGTKGGNPRWLHQRFLQIATALVAPPLTISATNRSRPRRATPDRRGFERAGCCLILNSRPFAAEQCVVLLDPMRSKKEKVSPYQNRIKTPSLFAAWVVRRAKSRFPKLLKTQRTGWRKESQKKPATGFTRRRSQVRVLSRPP